MESPSRGACFEGIGRYKESGRVLVTYGPRGWDRLGLGYYLQVVRYCCGVERKRTWSRYPSQIGNG